MKYYDLSALFGLAILLISLGIKFLEFTSSYVPPPKPPAMWTIMCNDAGRYSFISYDRAVYCADFGTREMAEKEMQECRLRHLDFEDRRASGKLAEELAKEAARRASFKPCDQPIVKKP